jgi:flagellar basal-body rod protein FlgF
MQSGLYVSLSGQIALERRLATIANNIANTGTIGYRAEELKFETVISKLQNNTTSFSSVGKSYLSEKSGGMKQTGNPLDVAIQGAGWMSIQTASGIAYTRDGRMTMKATGELVTTTGNAILDNSGSPLAVNPAGGPPRIDHEGNIFQSGQTVGKIGLFNIDLSNGYLRSESSSVIPGTAATAIESFTADGFAQGFLEESNVNAVTEMTNLIMVTRNFDGLQTSIDESEASLKKAIQVLGGS